MPVKPTVAGERIVLPSPEPLTATEVSASVALPDWRPAEKGVLSEAVRIELVPPGAIGATIVPAVTTLEDCGVDQAAARDSPYVELVAWLAMATAAAWKVWNAEVANPKRTLPTSTVTGTEGDAYS